MEATKELSDVKVILEDIARADVTKEEVQAYYTKWAPRYNQDMGTIFHGPGYVAEQMNEYCKDKSIRILDVAAGTGNLAKQLVSCGFTNIDALEPSVQMIEEAKKTGYYKQFYIDFMGKNRLDINDGTYDAIASSGSMIPGHANDDSFEEMIRIIKPGGYIVFSMWEKYWFSAPEWAKQFDTHMKDLEDEGKWKILVRNKKERYVDEKDHGGLVFVIQKS